MVAPPTLARIPQPARRVPGADLGSLVEAGRAPAPPVPHRPVPGPTLPQNGGTRVPAPPVPVPEHVTLLEAALAEARYPVAAVDTAAVRQVAALDRATVDRVAAWIRHNPVVPLPKV